VLAICRTHMAPVTSQGMDLSCSPPGAIMGQEAGKLRAVWLIHSSAIFGGGHRPITGWFIRGIRWASFGRFLWLLALQVYKEKKRNHIFATKDSARDRRSRNRDTESMASDPSSEIREQGLCKSFRLNLNVPICYMYFWDARATDFTLRSCMNDSYGQVFSLKKVVRHADYDLLILFLCKDRIKR
jgi:hypothetical protein